MQSSSLDMSEGSGNGNAPAFKFHDLPFSYFAALAQLDNAVNHYPSFSNESLCHTSAVAKLHNLQQAVQFDKLTVFELKIFHLHPSSACARNVGRNVGPIACEKPHPEIN